VSDVRPCGVHRGTALFAFRARVAADELVCPLTHSCCRYGPTAVCIAIPPQK